MNNKICTFLVMGILMNININDAQGSEPIRDIVKKQRDTITAPIPALNTSETTLKETLKQKLITCVEEKGNKISEKTASTFFDALTMSGNYIDMTKKDFMSGLREILMSSAIETKNIHGIIREYSKYLKSQTTFEKAHSLCTLLFSCMSNCIDSMKSTIDEAGRGEAM